ncbi:MAG: carbohydrate-binding protein [Ruminococcus sp.]|nr:carbohydrate-binding protein [Ruminococcus sp.]
MKRKIVSSLVAFSTVLSAVSSLPAIVSAEESQSEPLSVSISVDGNCFIRNTDITIDIDIKGDVPDDAWITFVPSEIPHTEKDSDEHNVGYSYLKDIKDGRVTLKAPSYSGNYDIRVFDSDYSDDAKEIACLPILLRNSYLKASASVDSRIVKPSTDINIFVEMSGDIQDDAWITFIPSEIEHTEAVADDYNGKYIYLKNIEDGVTVLRTPEKEGYYDIRIFNGDDRGTAEEIFYLPIIVTEDTGTTEKPGNMRSALSKIQAEDIDYSDGPDYASTANPDAKGSDGGCIGWISNGSCTAYYGIDFGDVPVKNFICCASNSMCDNAELEVHIDKPDGVCIGTLNVPRSDSWNNYEEDSCGVLPVAGVHDVYFVYRGSAAAIMNVDYFMFNTDETADTSIKGDINNDGHFNISDAVVLQKWLINAKNADAVKWKNGDMNEDGVLDVYDLVLMKSALVIGPDKAFVTVSDISWDKENKTVTFIPVFGGNYAEDAWIGVVPKDTPTDERSADNYDMDYLYLSNIESGKKASLSTDSSEGIFELRVYADDNGGELLFCKEFGKN